MSDEMVSNRAIVGETKSGGPLNNPMNLTGTVVVPAGVMGDAAVTYKIVFLGDGAAKVPNGATQIVPPQGVTVQSFHLQGTDANGGHVDHDFDPAGVLIYQMP